MVKIISLSYRDRFKVEGSCVTSVRGNWIGEGRLFVGFLVFFVLVYLIRLSFRFICLVVIFVFFERIV